MPALSIGFRATTAFFSLSVATSVVALGDWTTSSTVGTPVVVASGDQVQPKIVGTSDGGCYISWFDNRTGGYDVYLQRFDALGNPAWQANGILIADLNFSSTQDYGLDVDGLDRALLVFQDDRFGGIRATAHCVTMAGVHAWGLTGIQVSAVTDSPNSPRICAASDNAAYVGWNSGTAARVQRISVLGSVSWTTPVTLGGTGTQIVSGMGNGGSDGSAIVSVVQYATFTGAKVLKVQKLSTLGAPMWGAVTKNVFTTGSLQFGNFPGFVSDGAGGAVFAWYLTGPLQSWVQRVDSAGTLLFGTNGISVTTTSTGMERTAPTVVFDVPTGRTIVTWEQNLAAPSTDNGSAVQAFDSLGNRLWGANGVAVHPMTASTFDTFSSRVCIVGDQTIACGLRWSSGVASTLNAASFDALGTSLWTGSPVPVCNAPVSQGRPVMLARDGGAIISWEDSRSGTPDIYAAFLRTDGTLGNPSGGVVGDVDGDGFVSGADLAILLSSWGQPGAGNPADVDGDGAINAQDLSIMLAAWTG
ncbi:MAG: dockerin type I domain-containing protein [Planctomycetota bacterium]|nr:dockerin type I domain-containing protein [Planctomycetota bacterium]